LADLEAVFLGLTLLGLLLGGLAIAWARTSRKQIWILLGRCLFIATLLLLAGGGIMAAMQEAESLIPLGLTAGLLVMGMLCEMPHPAWHD
jgi:hypothetical protein